MGYKGEGRNGYGRRSGGHGVAESPGTYTSYIISNGLTAVVLNFRQNLMFAQGAIRTMNSLSQ